MATETVTVVDDSATDTVKAPKLIVFNDSINTFENVISALVDVCEHTPDSAEQCAVIIHNKGKYAVKSGIEHDKLLAMQVALLMRGLDAEVE